MTNLGIPSTANTFRITVTSWPSPAAAATTATGRSGAGLALAIVQLITATSRVTASPIQTLSLLFTRAAFTVVVCHTGVAARRSIAIPLAVTLAFATRTRRTHAGDARLPILPLPFGLRLFAFGFIGVRLGRSTATRMPARSMRRTTAASVALTLTLTLSVSVSVSVAFAFAFALSVVVTMRCFLGQASLALLFSSSSIVLGVFFFLLETTNDFFKRASAEVIRVQHSEVLGVLDARTHLFPRVRDPDWRVEMFDPRSQRVDSAPLLTLGLMFIVLATSDDLFMKLIAMLASRCLHV